MRGFIVDTHAVLWFLQDSPRLSRTAHALITDPDHMVFVSSASIWEIAVKAQRRLLDVPPNLPDVLRKDDFASLSVTVRHAWHVRELEHADHLDPFDRIIAAQSHCEDLPVISNDAELDRYGVVRRW